MKKTDVLIIGAGPTGLMAANQLARFNVNFIIVDGKSGPTVESRAIAVSARSMELYEQLGLSEAILKRAQVINSVHVYSGGKKRATVPIAEIGKGLSDFGSLIAFEQSLNEQYLYKHLQEQGHEVEWNTPFIQFEEYKNRIIATVEKNGTKEQVQAKYAIACDGAKSPVRHQLNFSFEGGTYEQLFFVADCPLQWDMQYDELIISPGKENFCAFFPMNGDKNYRVIGTIPRRLTDNQNLNFNDLKTVISDTLGLPVQFGDANWFSLYRLHHRGVDHFQQDMVFLAGDSAHIHSPAGGQGMNTGLQDAHNLAWKLAMVLKDQAKPSLLSTYNEERLPFARWLLRFTDRGFKVMSSRNPFLRFVRKYIALPLAGIILKSDRMKKRAFKTVGQISYSYEGLSLQHSPLKKSGKIRVGQRLPYFAEHNIYRDFAHPSFHLLTFDEKLSKDHFKHLPVDTKIVHYEFSSDWKNLGTNKNCSFLVRPDQYICAIVSNDAPDSLIYLQTYFK